MVWLAGAHETMERSREGRVGEGMSPLCVIVCREGQLPYTASRRTHLVRTRW